MEAVRQTWLSLPGTRTGVRLPIIVPFTDRLLARAALEAVARLGADLRPSVTVLAVHIVPYPQSLAKPELLPQRLVDDLESLGTGLPFPVEARVLIARDREQAFCRALASQPLVVIASRARLWATREQRLAHRLERGGCSVALCKIS